MNGERIVLCHSLACSLWLRHARDWDGSRADRVLLVAPPCTDDVPAVVRFRPDGVGAGEVRAAARVTRMVCAPEDSYCPRGAIAAFAEPLAIPVDVIERGGHLNADAGYGPWPAVEQWAVGAREAVGAR